MCGIAGVVDFENLGDVRGLLRRMAALLHHRGPDAAGLYLDRTAGLAHTRLSILDLQGGDQPIHNEDRTLWIVFNGEIFNYLELRRELETGGHAFYTNTDTEVLVHLFEEHGVNMFRRLNGQFAFALWDTRKRTLLLGRDRLGIRPLFYHAGRRRLVFGSEIKAIFADPSIRRALDTESLADILTCWTPLTPRTAFEGILQLPPAHYAFFSQRGLSIGCYWELAFPAADAPEGPERNLAQWREEFRALLKDAVRVRLRADVPVGAYLSGGLDSTYTSAIVKNNFKNQLCTFSVNFADHRFDEAPYQAQAVDFLKTDHRAITCSSSDIAEIFPDVIWHTEAPILRTAPAPLYRLSSLVRASGFKVVLTGEGADELFAGYNVFKEDKIRRFWARRPESTLRPQLLARLYPYIFNSRNQKSPAFLHSFFKKHLADVGSPAYSHMLRWQNTSRLKAFLDPERLKSNGDLSGFTERFCVGLPQGFMNWHPLSRAQFIEIKLFLSDYLLSAQGDRMAMANAVEGRYPFLDHRVVEFATRVPPRYRLNGLQEKFVLKQAARDLIPDTLIDRPKQPYRAPIGTCFFTADAPEYVDDLLAPDALQRSGYFDARKVAALVDKCRRQDGRLLSERENMALVGILSTQLLDYAFIRNFPSASMREPDAVKEFS